MEKKNFNKALKELRKEKGLTQSQVANALGIKLNTYAHMENGGKLIDPEMLDKLSTLFHVSVNRITGRNDPPKGVVWTNDIVAPTFILSDSGAFGNEKEIKKEKFMKDLHSAEQDIILRYRMLPPDEQAHIVNYVIRTHGKYFPKKD